MSIIDDALEDLVSEGAIFIPSHLTKALVATGVAMGASGIAILAGGYALFEFRRVKVEEILAMIKPPKGG